jgi:3-carboxy-cis,cis-muconate cycloisomerase
VGGVCPYFTLSNDRPWSPDRLALDKENSMRAGIIDSSIFGNIFTTDDMRHVWSDENRTAKYLEVEKALAKVQGRLGIIPREAADEIAGNCDIAKIDMGKLRAQTERIGYPVLGVVSQLNALCRDKLGEYCHWGATTQDITDTATVLQIREGLDIVDADLAAISASLAGLARRYRDVPVIGRSNLQQAIPVTFGFKMAAILAGIERHRERLGQLRPRVLMGEFGGACGTLASIQGRALEMRHELMRELGLATPTIAWHTVRDTIAEVGAFLGLVGGSLGKIAMDVKLMMQTEVGELYEPYAPGRGSSSTMPQKRNPISSCYIHAAISVVRQHAAALMDAMVADHERSTGPWEIEWIVLPEAFCLLAGALKQTRFVLSGLEVDVGKMRDNIDITGGLVMSEAVMMGLGPHIGREYAHDLVYELCREAIRRQRPLIDVLAAHPEVRAHLGRDQLAALCDPANYLGHAGAMIDEVLRCAATRSTDRHSRPKAKTDSFGVASG